MLVKVSLRGGFGSVNPITHLDDIQVNFHDALLTPAHFNQRSKIYFEALSHKAAHWEEKSVFSSLLRNGGSASGFWMLSFLLTLIILHRFSYGFEIETMMPKEILVFGGNHC